MKTGSESERRPEKMKERKEIRKERKQKINYFVCVLMFFYFTDKMSSFFTLHEICLLLYDNFFTNEKFFL